MLKKIMVMVPILFVLDLPLGQASLSDDINSLKQCVRNWEKHPFGKISEKTKFDVLNAKVKVMGIGDETIDNKKTDKPRLVLVKPNVSVMSKTKYSLLNPNGWYCIKGSVTVMSKKTLVADCKAKLAYSSGGATVMGSNDSDSARGGVTVLGKSLVKRINCK